MDTEFFKELERFSLLVKKRVSTAYTGAHRSLRFGHGISPVGYREYRKGDDFKLVDWKVYGRTERLYIREHEEERSLVVHILLDASGSMNYGGKFGYASQIAAGFGYLATLENEKYSVSLFCNRLHPGEPRRGRRYLFQTIGELDEINPRGSTNPRQVADQFETLVRSTSLVIVISDFLADTEEVLSSIYRLGGHDLVMIQVLAPDEALLNFRGDVKFVDMETRLPVVTRVTEDERRDYLAKMEEHNSRIVAACNQVGADFFSFKTDKPIFEAFSEMLSRAVVWKV
ncbi:MAG: DUF58 domain-containing protein [Methanotrichaceae archaeon]|nr:DUF58 domain-containing protein [Methanotrichaceae archaeon]